MAVFTAEAVWELPTSVTLCSGSAGGARATGSKKVTWSRKVARVKESK